MTVRETGSSRGVIRFGAYEIDPRASELRKHGIRLKVQDQPFRVLQILLDHPGEVVTREELQRQIWPSDTFVDFDRGLNNAVRRLRDALGDTAETPRFIETLPKRGYRFIAVVTGVNGTDKATDQISKVVFPAKLPRSLRLATLAGLAVLLLAASALAVNLGGIRSRFFSKKATPAIHSLAVLPLQNLSGDPNQEYFADGMTEELITDLSQINALRVASHQSVLRYKKSAKSLPDIARELSVDALVAGSVQRTGDHVRVTAQLIYGPEDKNLWAKSYERDFQNALALQVTVATAIVEEIRGRMTKEEKASLNPSQPANPHALEAFLQGRFYAGDAFDVTLHKAGGRKKSEEAFAKAIASFEEAIKADPKYVPAYLELAAEIIGARGTQPHPDLDSKAQASLTRALALDATNPAAHLLMADFLGFGAGWDEPETHYREAIRLSPDLAEAHESYAEYLDDLGRFEEGMREHQKAQELDRDTDHISQSPLTPLAERLQRKRKFMAITAPNGIDYWQRGDMEFEAGEYAEAHKDWVGQAREYGWNEMADSWDRAYLYGGGQMLIRQIAKDFDEIAKDRWFPRDMIINAHRYAGDRQGALAWLETAYKEDDRIARHLRSDSRWDPYRSEPRFQKVALHIGLAP